LEAKGIGHFSDEVQKALALRRNFSPKRPEIKHFEFRKRPVDKIWANRYCLSMHLIFSLLLLCLSCVSPPPSSSKKMTEICGRDAKHTLIYRVDVPSDWEQVNPLAGESLTDTTKSLCEFFIRDQPHTIRIAIHNFPTENMEQRIAPMAQIARWKKQFTKLDSTSVTVTPQAFGGFSGFLFEGTGLLKDQPTAMMGWSMQMAPEHYRKLQDREEKQTQMRADYTIKITGPTEAVKKFRSLIVAFARSFELIDDIPYEAN
jgi:hypothetical protein